ncbi:pyridoxamine 5'-phosphate oxidase family protein [Rhodococcus sp. D2-41]|uniref:Pyridoxamine 5'-phosphate oxidase family protein n=1 Tax=Speluncibacter jeojiensis TaxID=2710754 RepID=A0A9X4M5G9_9ACTN|nr:pyridoxamine 5'-phosphate oxidase family protein [Rhodococcus sp. D2-41]MDG3010087.1 pyridoxamine 5'-phosphate oxidase family protein [Rhodococcus sp. D2-41]MDG3015633.1 pyridoxamine 5'-phosphate oxidase family protein [Corynebacteriales bacterium D3-21]
MADWSEFEQQAPDLAAAVRARFEAHRHHVLATLRTDGSPRVSGTEVEFAGDEMRLGSMFGARKALDLQRDPRFAVHANPGEHTMVGGDAKLSGRAAELTGAELDEACAALPPELLPCHYFTLDLDQVVLTEVLHDPDRMRIRSWRPGQGVREFWR